MRNFIIKLLGGMTKLEHFEEVEVIKDSCEQFCKKHLHLNGDNHSWKGRLENATTTGNLIVLRSENSAINCTCKSLIIAPWVRKFHCSGITYK